MTDVDDLVVWWRGVLDRVEQGAREADPAPTAEDAEFGDNTSPWGDPHGEFRSRGGPTFAHVLLHDPTAVLASITADRALMEFCAQMLRQDAAPGDSPDDVDPTCWYVLRLRAAAYAHHPGYREGWRP